MKTIEIDLLPAEEAPESPHSIRNIFILVISLLVFIFLAFLILQMNNLKDKYVQRHKELMHNLLVYKKQKKEVEKLQERKNRLESRYELISEILSQRITWYDKLSDMHRQIPENVWLSRVSMETQEIRKSQKEPVILLRVLGYTSELSKIGLLISNLDNSEFFENTEFKQVDKVDFSSQSLNFFEITTELTRKS